MLANWICATVGTALKDHLICLNHLICPFYVRLMTNLRELDLRCVRACVFIGWHQTRTMLSAVRCRNAITMRATRAKTSKDH